MLTEKGKFLREEKKRGRDSLALSEIDVRRSLATLQEAILQLDELFLVVTWEIQRWQSALINALLVKECCRRVPLPPPRA